MVEDRIALQESSSCVGRAQVLFNRDSSPSRSDRCDENGFSLLSAIGPRASTFSRPRDHGT